MDIEKLATEVMLPPDEVQLWLNHLQTVSNNRKRGAEKRRKKSVATQKTTDEEMYQCGVVQEYIKMRRMK